MGVHASCLHMSTAMQVIDWFLRETGEAGRRRAAQPEGLPLQISTPLSPGAQESYLQPGETTESKSI